MTRGSSLSDNTVIKEINDNFIAYELNISNEGFPDVHGLKPWATAYQKDWRYSMAFATSVVVDPTAQYPLGTSGSGHVYEYETAINYHPDQYVNYLKQCRDRFARLQALEHDPGKDSWQKAREKLAIRGEIVRQLKEVNTNKQWGHKMRWIGKRQ